MATGRGRPWGAWLAGFGVLLGVLLGVVGGLAGNASTSLLSDRWLHGHAWLVLVVAGVAALGAVAAGVALYLLDATSVEPAAGRVGGPVMVQDAPARGYARVNQVGGDQIVGPVFTGPVTQHFGSAAPSTPAASPVGEVIAGGGIPRPAPAVLAYVRQVERIATTTAGARGRVGRVGRVLPSSRPGGLCGGGGVHGQGSRR